MNLISKLRSIEAKFVFVFRGEREINDVNLL